MLPGPQQRTCSGVPESAHLYLDVSANTARAVEQRRSLMLCASSRTTRRHLTCVSRQLARQLPCTLRRCACHKLQCFKIIPCQSATAKLELVGSG